MSNSTLRSRLREMATESFITEDNDVQWMALAQTLLGAVLVTLGLGIAAIQNAAYGLLIGFVEWLTVLYAGIISRGLQLIISMGMAAWEAAIGAIGTGLGNTVLGVSMALGFLLIWRYSDG